MLLEKGRVQVAPGHDYHPGTGGTWLNIATSPERLTEIVHRAAATRSAYPGRDSGTMPREHEPRLSLQQVHDMPAPDRRRRTRVRRPVDGLLCLLAARHHDGRPASTSTASAIDTLTSEGPIHDDDISRFLAEEELDLTFTTDPRRRPTGAEFVIIATPTNYDPVTNYFNTGSVEAVIATSRISAGRDDGREVDDPDGLRRGRARRAWAPTT